jgi:PAS domain S-box-containing protein
MFKLMRKHELRINRVRQEWVTAAWSRIDPGPVAFCLVPLYSDCITPSHDGLTMSANVDRSSSQSHDFIDLFENGALGLHFIGPDGIILNANQAELDFLGYSQDEYIGHHIVEFHVDAPVIEDILTRLSRKEILKKRRGSEQKTAPSNMSSSHRMFCGSMTRSFIRAALRGTLLIVRELKRSENG